MPLPGAAYLPGDPVTGDGVSLLVGDCSSQECELSVLDPEEGTWTTSGNHVVASGGVSYAASPGYLLVLGDPIEVLDRSAGSWAVIDAPENLRGIQDVHATGEEFILWSGRDTEDPSLTPQEIAEDPNTPWLQFYDGHLLDAATGDWEYIPPARPDARYSTSDGGPSVASVWTSAGLFVWGTNAERTEAWGSIFDVETMSWEELETGPGSPPVRMNHRLLSLGDEVYLFAGHAPGSTNAWRSLWRYSLSQREWREVEDVPSWADPLIGTVVDDKLAFLGRCVGGDLYDPATETWTPLGIEGGPPSSGVPRGAGSFLTVTDTYYGETETNAVWVLDLRE